MKFNLLILLLLFLIPTCSNERKPESKVDAKSTAIGFLRTFGESGAVERTEVNDRSASRYPSIDVAVYFQNGQRYSVDLTPDGATVKFARGETRTDARRKLTGRDKAPAIASTSAAQSHIQSLVTKLYGTTPTRTVSIKFRAEKVLNGKSVGAGSVTARVDREFAGLHFVDRQVGVSFEIDPLDKGLITFARTPSEPESADLSARITRQEAVNAWASKYGRPASQLADYFGEVGLATAPGASVARPAWAFTKPGASSASIFVDCKSKTVFLASP
jgi:hypothetical protein